MIALACVGAQAQESKVRLFGSLGFAFGGDTLVSGTYTNGDSFSVKAGDGLLLSGGLSYAISDKVDLQGSVGYQSASTTASNGKIDFTRYPVELLALYNIDNTWRVGGGVRSATSPKLSTSGVAGALGSYEFTPSVGAVLEAQYMFNANPSSKAKMGINVRYVTESFEENVSKTKVKGDSLGLGLVIYY